MAEEHSSMFKMSASDGDWLGEPSMHHVRNTIMIR